MEKILRQFAAAWDAMMDADTVAFGDRKLSEAVIRGERHLSDDEQIAIIDHMEAVTKAEDAVLAAFDDVASLVQPILDARRQEAGL